MILNLRTPTFLYILSFVLFCVHTNCQNQQANPNKRINKMSIKLEKEIIVSKGNWGTLKIAKSGKFLVLHEGHVSDRNLVCLNYETKQELWRIDANVYRFYIYKNNVIVQYHRSIAAYQLSTGLQLWKLEDVNIFYKYKRGSVLPNEIIVDVKEGKRILNLETQKTYNYKKGIVEAFYFQRHNKGTTKSIIGTENYYPANHKLLLIAIVKNNLNERYDYVWTLDEKKRIYYLTTYNVDRKKINEICWDMDDGKRLKEDAFSGIPEPEKLSEDVFFIDNQLFFYENYTSYRWSYGKGTNRITCVDWKTGGINYQEWGRKPADEQFYKFHFFEDVILKSDQTMDFQEPAGNFFRLNTQKGIITDSLEQNTTLFKDYNKNYLVGFNYKREQIANSKKYDKIIEMNIWDKNHNQFSKNYIFNLKENNPYAPFVFSSDRLIIIYFREHDKTTLMCYRVE